MRKRIRISVEATVAVGGEAVHRVLRVEDGGGDEGDPVEDERVALQPLRPGEGGECGEDEEGEDQAGPGLSLRSRHCPRRRSPRPARRRRPIRCRTLISRTSEMPSALGDLAGFGGVAAFEHDDAVGEAGAAVGDGAKLEALALDFVAEFGGEAGDRGAVEHRHFDFARLRRLRRLGLAALAVGRVGTLGDEVGDAGRDQQRRRRRSRPGSAARRSASRSWRSPREALAPGQFRQARLAARRRSSRWSSASRSAVRASSSARSSSARLAATAEVESLRSVSRSGAEPAHSRRRRMSRALGEGEHGEDGEAEKRSQACEGADFLDQLHGVAARGYSS